MRYEKGTGRLRRRKKNGRYIGNYFFKFDGHRVSTGTDDRREAGAFRRKFLGDIEHGLTQVRPDRATVNDLFDLVVEDYERRRRKSVRSLRSRLKHLRSALGEWAAHTVTETEIENYEEFRDDQGAEVATVNRELQVFRQRCGPSRRSDQPLS